MGKCGKGGRVFEAILGSKKKKTECCLKETNVGGGGVWGDCSFVVLWGCVVLYI